MQENIPAPARASSPAVKSAVIGPGIEIAGDVTASADLNINGKIQGNSVQSSHNVDVGESGTVRANISGLTVKIAGQVEGDISGSEKVLITKTGNVRGNITAPRVQLEDGAMFKGSIDMNPGTAVKKEAATPVKGAVDSGKATPSTGRVGNGTGPAAAKAAVGKEPGLTLKSG